VVSLVSLSPHLHILEQVVTVRGHTVRPMVVRGVSRCNARECFEHESADTKVEDSQQDQESVDTTLLEILKEEEATSSHKVHQNSHEVAMEVQLSS
jgi:hypothetical protein